MKFIYVLNNNDDSYICLPVQNRGKDIAMVTM